MKIIGVQFTRRKIFKFECCVGYYVGKTGGLHSTCCIVSFAEVKIIEKTKIKSGEKAVFMSVHFFFASSPLRAKYAVYCVYICTVYISCYNMCTLYSYYNKIYAACIFFLSILLPHTNTSLSLL